MTREGRGGPSSHHFVNGVHPPPTLLPPLPIEPRGYTSPGRSLLLVASRSSDGSVRRAPSRVARGANGPHLSFTDFTALHIPRGSILIHAQSSAGVFSFSSLRQAVLENRTILETRVTGGINYNLQSTRYYSPFAMNRSISRWKILSLYWNSLPFRGGSIAFCRFAANGEDRPYGSDSLALLSQAGLASLVVWRND